MLEPWPLSLRDLEWTVDITRQSTPAGVAGFSIKVSNAIFGSFELRGSSDWTPGFEDVDAAAYQLKISSIAYQQLGEALAARAALIEREGKL